jgi:3-hydroxybutyryl-CoA dehydrogenase
VRVETIAVVGSGLMGRGIAYASAASGYRTIIHDVSAEALDRARKQIRADLDEGRARGRLTAGDADAAYERLQPETDLRRAVAEAGFVIEAVPEQIDLKLQVFARLDEACAEGVALASNTSSLSVTEIAAATRRPQSVVGMHFFNPVPKMKLVEIVRGLESGDDALRTTEQVARRMGRKRWSCANLQASSDPASTR